MAAVRTSALLSRAWASAAWPASATSSPASLNTGPTTGTSTSRIDSPVRTIAPPAPSAEWVTPEILSSARPAVTPASAHTTTHVITSTSVKRRRRGFRGVMVCSMPETAIFAAGCFWGVEAEFRRARRRRRHPRRLHRRPQGPPDLPPGLRPPHRPRRGGRGHLRPRPGSATRSCSSASGPPTTRPRRTARAPTSAPSTAPPSTSPHPSSWSRPRGRRSREQAKLRRTAKAAASSTTASASSPRSPRPPRSGRPRTTTSSTWRSAGRPVATWRSATENRTMRLGRGTSDLQAGDAFGDYQVLERLGEGAMGASTRPPATASRLPSR